MSATGIEVLRDDLRRYGLGWTLLRLVDRALRRLVQFRWVDCITLEPAHLDRELLVVPARYTLRTLTEAEVWRFAADPANHLSEEFLKMAFAHGDECRGILDGDKLASYGWYALGPTIVLRDLLVDPGPGWVYMHAGYTLPEYRGQRLHDFGMGTGCLKYAARGYRGLSGNLERANRASVRSSERLGWKRFGTFYRLGLGPRSVLIGLGRLRRNGFRVERAPQVRLRRDAEELMPDLASVLAEEREIMEEFAPYYRTMLGANSYVLRDERRRFVEWSLVKLRDAGRDPTTLRYLDVGCGSGEALDRLAEAGCTRLTGLDLTPAILREARRSGPRSARWLAGAVESSPLRPESFDVVMAAFTVHHLHDVAPFFELADELLAPGGWFFVLEFDPHSALRRRRTSRRMHRYLGPLRWAIEHKPPNRSRLRDLPDPPLRSNSAYRERSHGELRDAVPGPDRYWLYRESHGFAAPVLQRALVEESAVDRIILRGLRRFDAYAERFGPGYFQWLAGQRRGETGAQRS